MRFEQIWQGKNCAEPNGASFPARVPGNIQYDYGMAHGFSDVQFADQYKQYLRLENDAWEYTARLQYTKAPNERVWFVSEGIDYRCDILLNGKKLLSHEGMFSRVEVELCELLGDGKDELTVHVYPHPKSQRGVPDTRDEANACCKAPVCYGWDWNPRLLISGMWQDAYIETRDAHYIGDAEALTSLNEDMSEGYVDFSYICEKACEVLLLDADGNELCRSEGKHLTLQSPRLWWCRGQGEPYLYQWIIRNEHEERRGTVGFRRVRLVRNIGASDPRSFPKGPYPSPATIELNGRRILAKGSNWVNPELFWGNIDEKRYDELLTLARDAEMNLLRLWGGASVCKKSFYELCDRYGIMVWQEFMLACNLYPDTDDYLHVLEQEARAIIHSLRSHPSITLWCGGNELFNGWSGLTDQSLSLRLLNRLCYELDRNTPFLFTSPLYGMGHGHYAFDSKNEGECFHRIAECNFTAYTEFGVPGMSSIENLKKIIPADELYPPRPTEAWVAHHGFGAWEKSSWLHLEVTEKYFGEASSIEELYERSSWLQSIGYKLCFEEMRRQWPHCGMIANWCFDEPWITAANNSVIEYPAKPKPAYFAVKEALRPTLFSARIPKFMWTADEMLECDLYLLNDRPQEVYGKVKIAVRIDGETYHLLDWEATAPANGNVQGPTVRMKLPRVQCESFEVLLQNEDGFESSYKLRYRPKKRPPAVRVLNM